MVAIETTLSKTGKGNNAYVSTLFFKINISHASSVHMQSVM